MSPVSTKEKIMYGTVERLKELFLKLPGKRIELKDGNIVKVRSVSDLYVEPSPPLCSWQFLRQPWTKVPDWIFH
jgi:hypothetical protein